LYCVNPYNDPPSPELPWGHFPYGDRVIIDCIDRGMTADEILRYYLSPEAEYLPNLDHLHRIESGRLAARDAKCDVKMAGYVFEQFRRKQLFWCINHPALPALCEQAKRLLDPLRDKFPELQAVEFDHLLDGPHPEGPLGFFRVPVHPAVAKHFDLAWYSGNGSPELYGSASQLVSYEEYFSEMVERSLVQRDLTLSARA